MIDCILKVVQRYLCWNPWTDDRFYLVINIIYCILSHIFNALYSAVDSFHVILLELLIGAFKASHYFFSFPAFRSINSVINNYIQLID